MGVAAQVLDISAKGFMWRGMLSTAGVRLLEVFDIIYDYDYIMAPQRGRPYGANLGSMGRNTGTWYKGLRPKMAGPGYGVGFVQHA